MDEPVILCPTRFERTHLHRALRACMPRGRSFSIRTIGIGPCCVDRAAPLLQRGGHVILSGVAGALTGDCHIGAAYWVSDVRDNTGASIARLWTPLETPTCVPITSASQIITTGEERRLCARATGAWLVDLESELLARAAADSDCALAVVKGVSDDAMHDLPASIGNWLSESGRARPMHVMRSMVRGEVTLAQLSAMRRNSVAALGEAARLIAGTLAPTNGTKEKPAATG